MKVRLIQNVIEDGRIKASIRAKGTKVFPFTAGSILDMSEASAKKYVEKGLAVYLEEGDGKKKKDRVAKPDGGGSGGKGKTNPPQARRGPSRK